MRGLFTRGKLTIARRTFVFTARGGTSSTQSRISAPNVYADAALVGIMRPSENTRMHVIIKSKCAGSLVRQSLMVAASNLAI